MRISALLISVVIATSWAQVGQVPRSTQSSDPPMGQPRPDINDPTYRPGATTDTTQIQPKVDDKKFLKDAALGGMTEVELGKLAAEKASNEAVKQFAQKMVEDHSKAVDELKQVAGSQSVRVPDSLDSKHRSRIDKLSKLSGPDFDRAYVKDQLKDHQQDVREFQMEAQNGTDANVKSYAAKTLPTLQQHLEMAKNLNNQVKK